MKNQLFIPKKGQECFIVLPDHASDYLKSSAELAKKTLDKAGFTCEICQKRDGVKPSSVYLMTPAVPTYGGAVKITYQQNGTVKIAAGCEAIAVRALFDLVGKAGSAWDKAFSEENDLSAYAREKWHLALPAYEGGAISASLYDCGTALSVDTTELRSFADSSYMECVSDTSKKEFTAYLSKLKANGYKKTFKREMENNDGKKNVFAQYSGKESLVYAYFDAKRCEARIIEDRSSTPLDRFGYENKVKAPVSSVYLYGLKLHPRGINAGEPDCDPNYNNCGAFLMVKQSDNSLFVIDGGAVSQATDRAVEGLFDYMHKILGTKKSEPITLSCWFITHAHGDHETLIIRLIEKYGDLIRLERVMLNYPSIYATGLARTDKARRLLKEKMPEIPFNKCHTGERFSLGDLTIDVLAAHEDAVNAKTGVTEMASGNDMTSVIRVGLPDGSVFMVLGDYTASREESILRFFSPEFLKSDLVQVAHHSWNSLPDLYLAIAAPHALWPQYEPSNFTGKHYDWAQRTTAQLKAGGALYHYYAGLNTFEFVVDGGKITVNVSDLVF